MQAEFYGGPIDGGFLEVPARYDGVIPVLYVMWQRRGSLMAGTYSDEPPLKGYCYRRYRKGYQMDRMNIWEYEYLGEIP
jgi:hypothetical protein